MKIGISAKNYLLNIFLQILFAIFLFLISTNDTEAGCYFRGSAQYNTCMADPFTQPCFPQNGQPPAYACCDTWQETCPGMAISPTPIPPPCASPNSCASVFSCQYPVSGSCGSDPSMVCCAPNLPPTATNTPYPTASPTPTLVPGCYRPGDSGFNNCYVNGSVCTLGGPGSLVHACCDSSVAICPDPPEHGYYVCNWNDGDSTCNTNTNPNSNYCDPNYFYPPNNPVCSNVSPDTTCYNVAVGCITNNNPFYCTPQGGCNPCPNGICPAEYPSYSDSSQCLSDCHAGATCGSIGGICRNSCNSNEVADRSVTSCSNSSQTCCVPGFTCTGEFLGIGGTCHLLTCPPGMMWDGINPPFNNGCPALLYACCVSEEFITPRPTLNPNCTRNGQNGIYSAVGCIPVSSNNGLLSFILPWAIGVGGGTAFILIIVGGFLVMTSAGNPERAKAGKELITAAISALLLIIFSVFVLDFIGIRIFRLPNL